MEKGTLLGQKTQRNQTAPFSSQEVTRQGKDGNERNSCHTEDDLCGTSSVYRATHTDTGRE